MTEPKIATIDVHELKKRCERDPNLCLIDVREDCEWEEGHIPHALHIPKDKLSTNIDAIIPERNKPIYLHCKGGVRSLDAARALLTMGYQMVYSIDGGIIEWIKSGYPIER